MKKIIVASLVLLGLTLPAQARHHYRTQPARWVTTHAHPDCNILWPCEGVVASPRGLAVVKAMRGFGTARKIYRHHAAEHRAIRNATSNEAPKINKAVEKVVEVGRGVVRASTGAVAYVAGRATTAFQCVVDKLEAQGYRIKEMGGYANRGHIRGSLHYSGLALDVNQVERNVTAPRMPSNEIELANGCGLISGAQWRNGDSGHFQLGGYDGRVVRVAHRYHRRAVRVVDARRLE